jgi:hypothetical protein
MKRISSIFTVVVALLLLGSISVNAAPLMLGDSDQGEVIILARGGHGGHGPGDGTGNDGVGPDDGTGYGPGDGTCDDGTGDLA